MRRGRKLGYLKPSLAPTETVTNREILWAAGFFEGDGCAYRHRDGATASIGQKTRWPLEFMQRYFGGGVTPHGTPGNLQWRLTGARARGFLQTIYELVSPRRRKQIAHAMDWD